LKIVIIMLKNIIYKMDGLSYILITLLCVIGIPSLLYSIKELIIYLLRPINI